MPRPQQYAETSLSSRIVDWLREHPGAHRPSEIAAGLGVPATYVPEDGKKPPKSRWTVDIGRECSRMFSRGQLAKQAGPVRTGGGVRGSTYSLPIQ